MKQLAQGLSTCDETWERCLDHGIADRINRVLAELEADEGTIWLLDSTADHLLPVFNNGRNPANLVGSFRQPLDRGIISMIFATQSAMSERDVYRNPQHDSSADHQLGVVTVHMIVVPLYFADESRGVISAVRLRPVDTETDPPPFEDRHLESFKKAAREFGHDLDKCLHDFSQESPEP